MPKKPDQFHSWSVLVASYISEEVKQQIECGTFHLSLDNPMHRADTAYRGWGEVWASVRFYRACRDGVADPLALQVEGGTEAPKENRRVMKRKTKGRADKHRLFVS